MTAPGGNHFYFPHDSICEEHSGRTYSGSNLVHSSTHTASYQVGKTPLGQFLKIFGSLL